MQQEYQAEVPPLLPTPSAMAEEPGAGSALDAAAAAAASNRVARPNDDVVEDIQT